MTHTIADNAERVTLGSLELAVVYIGGRSFRWWVTDLESGRVASGDDLQSASAGPVPDNSVMLPVLAGFLLADAETYTSHGLGTREPQDGWLFGQEVAELAYQNSDELSCWLAEDGLSWERLEADES